jgi:hypothetical protein
MMVDHPELDAATVAADSVTAVKSFHRQVEEEHYRSLTTPATVESLIVNSLQ